MKNTFNRWTMMILLAAWFLVMACTSDDNPVDTDRDVANTDFVAEESFSFQLAVINHARLGLEGINGNITINGDSKTDSVIVTGTKRVGSESTADAEAHLDELDVSMQNLTMEVLLRTTQPQETHGRNYVVDYTITVPDNFEVTVVNVNGTVTIESINSLVTVENENGQITLGDISASVYTSLTNGQISGEVTLPWNGTIEMDNTNGNIELELPSTTSAEFSARVVNGNIVLSNIALQNQVSSSTSLSGTMGDGQGTISLVTVNGNISVSGI